MENDRTPFVIIDEDSFGVNNLVVDEGHLRRLLGHTFAIYNEIGFKLLRSSQVSELLVNPLGLSRREFRQHTRKLKELGYINIEVIEDVQHFTINDLPIINDKDTRDPKDRLEYM